MITLSKVRILKLLGGTVTMFSARGTQSEVLILLHHLDTWKQMEASRELQPAELLRLHHSSERPPQSTNAGSNVMDRVRFAPTVSQIQLEVDFRLTTQTSLT